MDNENLNSKKYQNALGNNPPIHPETKFGKNVRLGYGAVIEKDCKIGDNTFIGHHTVLRPETKIGNNCVIGHLTVFEGKCIIGDRVSIHAQCHIAIASTIEDDVFIAPLFCGANTQKIKHGRDFDLIETGYTIRRAVRIGIGVLLLPGVEIGENSMIGVGSVITKDVPPREIWFGNPAIKHGKVPEDEIL